MIDRSANERDVEQRTETAPSQTRLTRRDRELLAHVSTARYLSLPQLKKLVFVDPKPAGKERNSKTTGPSDRVCRRRLSQLFSTDPPYLRRLHYLDKRGARIAVYAPAGLGLLIAQELLGRSSPQPGQDISPRFLEHTVRLNDLYVALAQASARQGVTPERYPFCWVSTDPGGLPWRERSRLTGQMEDRRIIPDAVLEFSLDHVRVFLECEMGGHHLVRADEYALTSVLGKLNRYASFMEEGAQETFYAQKYPDRWRAELAFLVHSEARAAKVSALIARWRRQNRAVSLTVTALSFDQAAAHFVARLPIPPPSEPPVRLESGDVQLTCSFVAQVAATYKAVRHYLRANPAIRAQGCPYPEYTPDFERMVSLVERYRQQLGLGSKP